MKTIEALPHHISSDKDAFDVIAFIDKGIVYNSFERIYKQLPFTLEQWAQFLDTTTRTLQRWKKAGTPLPALCADRIIEIYQLYKFGIEVFGTESFNKWLNSAIATLDDKAPVSFLNNSGGINLIRTKLGRIQHGVLA